MQVARRLSVNVSRRASSVYQFFQYKEELRTAKISALVIVVAFICFPPFFLNLALLSLDADHSDLIACWLHHLSNLFMFAFAALSPYLYVFRSSKVQKCLCQVIRETCCCVDRDVIASSTRRPQQPLSSAAAAATQEKSRERSSSCPQIVEEKRLHQPQTRQQERHQSPVIDDAHDLLYDKLLHKPPHVQVRPPAPVIAKTSSNLDVYNAVIYEEDGELVPPDEDLLSKRRLSASVPFGLNRLNPFILESTV